jgi:hypothetical protein
VEICLYKDYLNDYDYLHICGDDAYVIPDNIRACFDREAG